MKRSIAFVFACSTVSLVNTASAADGYEAVGATLFVPTESIPLIPSTECPVSQGNDDNAALGCVAGLDAATDYMPAANQQDVIDGLTTALAPYNVRVTTTRPPEFVPYMMLLPGDAVNPDSLSRTCAGAGIDCDGVKRNDIATTSGGSMFCMDPDPVQAALIAFGSMSGLEANDNAMDPMFYQAAAPFGPDYANPAVEYQDLCSNLVQTVDDMEMPNQIFCAASLYHEPYCEGMDNQTNGHLELEAIYGAGPVVEDTTPPEVTAIGIEDGAVIPAEGSLPLTATVTDDSGLVFVRWTLQSDALIGAPGVDDDGRVCKGHNGVCVVDFASSATPPYFQVEGGEFNATELSMVPGGEYVITFEASDLAGNTIEAITATVTVEGGDPTGDPDTTGGDDNGDDNGDDDNGDDDNGDDDDGDESGEDTGSDDTAGSTDDSGGCSCNTDGTPAGAAFMLVGLVGLGIARRRRD
jgi:MYXO-CTERM domain-containing protein